jgi:glycosyltransferase involved in cell wall biosynthesis
MWMGSRVVVVTPAWDEAPRIGRVLSGIPAWVDAIVVVDDASRDGTTNAARAVGDRRVEIVRHEENRGVGAAIVTGYRRALEIAPCPRDVFVVMAGDGQMDPLDLPALVTPVATGAADYVKGSRFGTVGVSQVMPVTRWLGGLVLSRATSGAIGTPISDSQCGYTAIAADACARLDLDSLWPGYGYPNDILSQLSLRRMRISEAPVRAIYADEVSRLRWHHVPVVAALVVRAWLRRTLLVSPSPRAVNSEGPSPSGRQALDANHADVGHDPL